MVRCEVCRTRRVTFAALIAHKAAAQHGGPCNCGGYHFPHRPASGCCEENGYAVFNRAKREGGSAEDRLEAFIDSALFGKHKPTTEKEIPF